MDFVASKQLDLKHNWVNLRVFKILLEIPVEEIMFKYIFKNKANKNLPTQGRLNQLIICANILIMLIYKN